MCDCEEEVEIEEGFDWKEFFQRLTYRLHRETFPGPEWESSATQTRRALLEMFKNLYSERDLVQRSTRPSLSEMKWKLSSQSS